MDHSFLSKRGELDEVTRGIRLLTAAKTLSDVSEADRALLVARKDAKIADPDVRAAAVEHGPHLGLLLEEVDAIAPGYDLAEFHGEAWAAFLLGKTTPPTTTLWKTLDAVYKYLDTRGKQLKTMDHDSGSSSYSDYSDSDTQSTEDDEEEDEEGEEKDEEGEN